MDAFRLLLIAHTFPPATGSGAHRALAFARYLPGHGWQPTVLTVRAAWAANRDDASATGVPESLRVVRTRSLEPRPAPASGPVRRTPTSTSPPSANRLSELRSIPEGLSGTLRPASIHGRPRPALARWLARDVAHALRFPDAHLGWLPFALAAGARLVRSEHPHLLYSTAAPFSSHLVGLLLQRLSGLPWVLELRDGWHEWNRAIFPDYPAWRNWLEAPLERTAITAADRVVLVTGRMAEAFRRQYRWLPPGHFQVVPNGYDPAILASPVLPPPSLATDAFEVLHAGAVYYGRSPGPFLAAAGRLAREDPSFARAFRLRLLGTLDESAHSEIAAAVARLGLAGSVSYEGQVGHQSALAAMRRASLLLLLANTTPGAGATVPAKLFEYLGVGRPVLALVPSDSEAADVVARTRGGWVAAADDVEAIVRALRESFQAHQQATPFAPDAAEVARFDRRALAGQLASLFDDVLASRGQGPGA